MKKKPFVVAVTTLVFVAAIFSGERAVTKLPGEDGTKSAISPAPFPDRMSAYVWRNWGLVPVHPDDGPRRPACVQRRQRGRGRRDAQLVARLLSLAGESVTVV